MIYVLIVSDRMQLHSYWSIKKRIQGSFQLDFSVISEWLMKFIYLLYDLLSICIVIIVFIIIIFIFIFINQVIAVVLYSGVCY